MVGLLAGQGGGRVAGAVAYLERANEQFWAWLDGACAGVDDPRARLVATFGAVGKLADSPQCLGCTFQGTAAEFPDPEHPGHRVAVAHKQAVLARLRGLAEDRRPPRPRPAAPAADGRGLGRRSDVRPPTTRPPRSRPQLEP